jgi:Fe-S cluster biogenesis protein NfuA
MPAQENLRATGDRIERLLDELQSTVGPRVYERVSEILRLVSELYGAGLRRVVELADESGPAMSDALVGDDLLASLLLVHGLHPDSLETRVERALEQVRPLLGGHGGDVELLEIDGRAGTVHLRLLGSCDGCPSSGITLQTAVERAITEAAPEIVVIDVDDPASLPAPVLLKTKPIYDKCPAETMSL